MLWFASCYKIIIKRIWLNTDDNRESNWKQGRDERCGEQRHGMKTKSDMNETKQIWHKTNMGVRTRHMIFATSFTLPPEKFSILVCSAPSMLQSLSPTEKLKLEILTAISVCGPRVGPGVGAPIMTPGYMMEQVKPQHSFSRVRPVLVKGEEVCWALDGTRLGTPGTQKKNHTVRKRQVSLCRLHLLHLKFRWWRQI